MAGTWESQNKITPGVYVNFRTNAPLSITPGERGIAVILQEVSVGAAGDIYELTLMDQSAWPDEATTDDKKLAVEALKNASKVIVYNLGTERSADAVETALATLVTVDFDAMAYPYDEEDDTTIKESIVAWVKGMCEKEGLCITGVLSNIEPDYEGIINVPQGIKLNDKDIRTAAETAAWVAGASAGAKVNESLTGKKYVGAVDVETRLTKSEIEEAIRKGQFVFKVDRNQNVTCVCDVNTLTTVTVEKGKMFKKNRVIRCLNGINNDITEIFESNFLGKINNNAEGRSMLKGMLVDYFSELQVISAIQNFTPEDVVVEAGTDIDAVVVTCNIQPVDSIEKIYIAVNLS